MRSPRPRTSTVSTPWLAPTRRCTIILPESMSAICGMIGNYARRPSAEAELSAMLDALAFRAPDGASTWRAPDGAARLGFRWLRTQDGESNPGVVVAPDGNLAMACDGHVFADDGKQGPGPLLERFAAKGPEGWRGLDAQFGLAI